MARPRTGTVIHAMAPCGLNCLLCYAYIREKRPCPGCRGEEGLKPEYCVTCKIKNCPKLIDYCYNCDEFPCAKIKRLEKRYTAKYATSVIENLNMVKNMGAFQFMKIERARRACPGCGGLICVHQSACPACGCEWRSKSST